MFGRNGLTQLIMDTWENSNWKFLVVDKRFYTNTYKRIQDVDKNKLLKLLQKDLNARIDEKSKFEGTIKRIGIITRNRPDQLKQSLGELLHNITKEFKHVSKKTKSDTDQIIIGVFNDSDPVYEDVYQKIIDQFSDQYKKYNLKIVHIDSKTKKIFKSKIKDFIINQNANFDGQSIDEAIELTVKPSHGGNRNWVSLYFGKQPYIMMDDDIRPRVSLSKNENYPVDILGFLNRAIGDGQAIAYYDVSVHQDKASYGIVLNNLNKNAVSAKELLVLEKKYYMRHIPLVERKFWQTNARAGLMAMNPNTFSSFTIPSYEASFRIEDLIIPLILEKFFKGKRSQFDYDIMRQSGSVDHERTVLDREDIMSTVFYELVGTKILYNILNAVIDGLLASAISKPLNERIKLLGETLIQLPNNEEYKKAIFRDDKFISNVEFVISTMMDTYIKVYLHKNLKDKEILLDDLGKIFKHYFGVTVEKMDLGSFDKSTWLRKMKKAAMVKLFETVHNELKHFGESIRFWPEISEAAEATFQIKTDNNMAEEALLPAIRETIERAHQKILEMGIENIDPFALRTVSQQFYKRNPENPFGATPESGDRLYMIGINPKSFIQSKAWDLYKLLPDELEEEQRKTIMEEFLTRLFNTFTTHLYFGNDGVQGVGDIEKSPVFVALTGLNFPNENQEGESIMPVVDFSSPDKAVSKEADVNYKDWYSQAPKSVDEVTVENEAFSVMLSKDELEEIIHNADEYLDSDVKEYIRKNHLIWNAGSRELYRKVILRRYISYYLYSRFIDLLVKKNSSHQEVMGNVEKVGTSPRREGGINFKRNRLNIKTYGEGAEWDLPMDPRQWENIDFDGLGTTILGIFPVSLPLLLSEEGQTESRDLSSNRVKQRLFKESPPPGKHEAPIFNSS